VAYILAITLPPSSHLALPTTRSSGSTHTGFLFSPFEIKISFSFPQTIGA
jgi:hypothetical protein